MRWPGRHWAAAALGRRGEGQGTAPASQRGVGRPREEGIGEKQLFLPLIVSPERGVGCRSIGQLWQSQAVEIA